MINTLARFKRWIRFKIARYCGFVVFDQPFFVCEKLEAGEWAEVNNRGYVHKSKKV